MKTITPAQRPTISPEAPFELAWSGGGEPPERTIDFGPDGVGGYPVIEVAEASGPCVLHVAYGCVPAFGPDGDFQRATSARYLGPEIDLPILPASIDRFDDFRVAGPGRHEAPLQQGLVRYVRVRLDTPGAAVRIARVRFENRGTHATEPVVGSFSCSDPALEALWRASVRTCRLAAIPARTAPLRVETPGGPVTLGPHHAYLSDGAKRDRLVWSGDLWFAQRNLYAAWGPDSPYLPGSLRMLAENQTPEGYVQACPYPESHGPVADGDYGPFQSDEFAAWFVPVLWDHLLYTGDFALARELYPNAVRLLGYLRRHTGGDGLFAQRPETSKHAAGLVFGGDSTHRRAYMNVLLWLVRRDAAFLARALGRNAEADAFEREAEATARAVRVNFLRADGLLDESLEKREPCAEAAALALAAGFFTQAEAENALARTPRIPHGKFQLLLVRGAFLYGMPAEALRRIREHNWLKLVDPAWEGVRATSECVNFPTRAGWGDEAHPDTALAGELTFGLLGLRPTSPGFATYESRPVPVPGLGRAEAAIPTPSGLLRFHFGSAARTTQDDSSARRRGSCHIAT